MGYFFKVFGLAAIVGCAHSSIGGLSYLDNLEQKQSKTDDCNPLYWYPKKIPDYCYNKDDAPPHPPPQPIPVPVPVQLPPVGVFQPIPPPISQLSYPYLPPGPPDPCACPPCRPPPVRYVPVPPPPPAYCGCPICPVMPVVPAPQIPFGVPIAPSYPMVPVPGISYSYYSSAFPRQMIGMVPGLPGIVSEDGGINIMPFSDAYSDILEKHKNEEFRRKYRRLIERIDGKYKTKSCRH